MSDDAGSPPGDGGMGEQREEKGSGETGNASSRDAQSTDQGRTEGTYTEGSSETDGRARARISINTDPSGRAGNTSGSSRMMPPEVDMEVEMQAMITSTAQETEDDNTLLSDSKDRAQMTANTALSLSLIVLLKELVDRGPDARGYYYVSMTLVCLSLLCQIAVGVLALVMYSLKSSHSNGNKRRNQSEIGTELQSLRVFPARYDVTDGVRGEVNAGYDDTDNRTTSTTEPTGSQSPSATLSTSQRLSRLLSGEAGRGGCCGPLSCCCPGGSGIGAEMSATDQATVKIYEILCLEQMKALLDVAEVRVRGQAPAQYGATGDAASSPLDDLLRERFSRLRVLGAQEKLVGLKVKMIRRRRLFRQVTAVQNAITYLLYVVFILNAFITGFGLA